jgi:futalosine hydrolase
MEYLIVSATSREIEPILRNCGLPDLLPGELQTVQRSGDRLAFLVTGVGMMQAAYHTGRSLEKGRYDHAIQAGIAGAFDRRLQMGEVVLVKSQRYGDLGVKAATGFSDVYDMGLADRDAPPFRHGVLVNNSAGMALHPGLTEASSLSVNRVSSSTEEITRLEKKYNVQLESMEGMAFHYACLLAGVSYAEIRTVSNYVEPRNRSSWDVEGAVEQLNHYLIKWLTGRGW